MQQVVFTPTLEHKFNTNTTVELPESSSIVATNLQKIVRDGPLNFKIMMTNLCNLSCSYCFQQHTKNTIPWTTEGLTLLLDGLIEAFPDREIIWDWFGGEPLIYKRLIQEFIVANVDKINNSNVTFELATNGTLLTEEFIKIFYQLENSHIALSLDTVMLEEDNRNLDKNLLAGILEKLNIIAREEKMYHSCVTITLSREQIKTLKQTLWTIHRMGGRNILVNPLVYNNTELVDWTKEELDTAADVMIEFANLHKDVFLGYGTEVNKKEEINCLVGSRLLSVDGSGDMSGCFFLTNDKESFKDTTMGNIFTGEVSHTVDKYANEAEKVLSNDPRCKTCDYSGLCTMCPVGVFRTTDGEDYFRSNSSCQAIVQNYIKVNTLMEEQNIPFRQNLMAEFNT